MRERREHLSRNFCGRLEALYRTAYLQVINKIYLVVILNLEIQVYVFFQWIICRLVVQFIGRLIFVILSVYIFIAFIKRICIRTLTTFQLIFQVLFSLLKEQDM